MVPEKVMPAVASPSPVLIAVEDWRITLEASKTEPPSVEMALPLRNRLPVVPAFK